MNDTYLYGEMFSENILTSYRIYGDRKSLLTPLIILHGGPSGGFDYLLNYRRLADDGRMVIFYDQYGCGRSTHFPHADASFWTIARYLRQLTQLIHHRVLGTGIRYWDIPGRNACRRARLLTACRASRDDTGQFAADPTGYHILWGTNELAANGKLADWDITPHLCQIRCPVLVLRGENDQATERVVSPLLSHISDCRAVTIPAAAITRMKKISRPASQR